MLTAFLVLAGLLCLAEVIDHHSDGAICRKLI
jgi:hypothetical protein